MELDVKRIRLLMAEKRFNVASLARASSISAATINLWLNHGKNARLDKIGALAKTLGVPVTAIIRTEGN